MKETMTVHKALSELKVLSSRIEKEINDIQLVTINKHSNQKISGVQLADFINQTRDNYKSVKTLINRRNAIKRAVTKSNAITTVEIGGKEYTVAEAIDMKSCGVGYQKALLNTMEQQYASATSRAERENGSRLDDRADAYIKSLYENADMKNLTEQVKIARDNFVESQAMDVIDPVNVQKEMKALRDEIDAFMSDVDSALSVSNALTTIEFEYETV